MEFFSKFYLVFRVDDNGLYPKSPHKLGILLKFKGIGVSILRFFGCFFEETQEILEGIF